MSRRTRKVTIREIAEHAGMTEAAVREHIRLGLIPGRQAGPRKGFFVSRPEFEAWKTGRWIPQPRPVEPIRPLRPVGLTRKAG